MKNHLLLFFRLSLILFLFSGIESCNEPIEKSEDNETNIYFVESALRDIYVIPEVINYKNTYVYNVEHNKLIVPLTVYRNGLEEGEIYTVSVVVSDKTVKETTQLPTEAYTIPDTVSSSLNNKRIADCPLEIDIAFLLKNKDTDFSITLELANPSKYTIDASMFSVTIHLKTATLLKEIGLYDNWVLKFEDNFDGSSINTTEWSRYNGGGHAGNGLRRPEAFSVENGNLVVTAQMKDGNLVSGGMAHLENYLYGRFEFRVKTENDPTEAVSGVVLTWPKGGNWPIDGENDIYETGTKAGRAYFATFIHYGADNKTKYFKHEVSATDWHIIGMDWSPNAIIIYRDGVKVWELTDTVAIPKVPHHLCIQLDAFKKVMGDPVRMYVDWARIYQLED